MSVTRRKRVACAKCSTGMPAREQSSACFEARHSQTREGNMISRRRFTIGAGAALAAGPFIHPAHAQGETVIRYGDVLPANFPSVVAIEAAGKEIAEKTSGRVE